VMFLQYIRRFCRVTVFFLYSQYLHADINRHQDNALSKH
jgi:hypothetical protein